MRGEGMVEVTNPSAAFLSERGEGATGSSVVVTMEGTRPMLVEVQALASRSSLAVPRRAANGIEINRLLLRLGGARSPTAGLPLHDQDLYVNVVGGLRIDEPAADLAVAVAIASSLRERPVRSGTVLAGELSLAGRLRAASRAERRLAEARRLGFDRLITGPSRSTDGAAPNGPETAVDVRSALLSALAEG